MNKLSSLAVALLCSIATIWSQGSLSVKLTGIDDAAIAKLLPGDQIGYNKDGPTSIRLVIGLVPVDRVGASVIREDNYAADLSADDWNKNWDKTITFEADKVAQVTGEYRLSIRAYTVHDNSFNITIEYADIKDGMSVSLNNYVYEKKSGLTEPVVKLWIDPWEKSCERIKKERGRDSIHVAEVLSNGSFKPICSGRYVASRCEKFFYVPGSKIDPKYYDTPSNIIVYIKTIKGNYLWTRTDNITLRDFTYGKIKLGTFSGKLGDKAAAANEKAPSKAAKLKPLKVTTSLPCEGSGTLAVINKASICVANPTAAGGTKKKGNVASDFVTKVGTNMYPIKAGEITYNTSNQTLVEGVLFQENRIKTNVGYIVLRQDSKVRFDGSTLTGVQLKEDSKVSLKGLDIPVMAAGNSDYDIEFNKMSGQPVHFKIGKDVDLFKNGIIVPREADVFLKGGKIQGLVFASELKISFNGQEYTVKSGTEKNPSLLIKGGKVVGINISSGPSFTVDGADIPSGSGMVEFSYDQVGKAVLSSFVVGSAAKVNVYKGSKSKEKEIVPGQTIVLEDGKVTKVK